MVGRGSAARRAGTPDGPDDRAGALLEQARTLTQTAERDAPADLDRAIELLRTAAKLPALTPGRRCLVLSELGFLLKSRYIRGLHARSAFPPHGRDTSDIDESIALYEAALELLPGGEHPYPLLSNLGQAHFGRCAVDRGDVRSAEAAVRYTRLAAASSPVDAVDLPPALASMVSAVQLLVRSEGPRAELEAALELSLAIVDRLPRGAPQEAECVGLHVELLQLVRERIAVDADDEERAWERLAATADPERPAALRARRALGRRALERFDRSGDRGDLDRAVVALQEAARWSSDADPERVGDLGLLGHALGLRAGPECLDADRDGAIAAYRAALELHPSMRERGVCVERLCALLMERFRLGRNRGDLEEIVEVYSALAGQWQGDRRSIPGAASAAQALEALNRLADSPTDAALAFMLRHFTALAAETKPDQGRQVGRLRSIFHEPYVELARKRRGHVHPDTELAAELDEQLGWLRAAPDRAATDREGYEELADILSARAIAVSPDDVNDELIAVLRRLLPLLPPDEVNPRALWRLHLGHALHHRFHQVGRGADLAEARALFALVGADSRAATFLRVAACDVGGQAAADADRWEDAAHAWRRGVDLFGLLAARHLSAEDFLHQLEPFAGLAAAAGAAAARCGDAVGALEVLERGRGLLIGRALDVRGDLHRLGQEHPRLAEQLRVLADELAGAVDRPVPETAQAARPRSADGAYQHARRWDESIAAIRRLPGFATFLAPVEVADLLEAAADGPVVTVNVSPHGCHALVLTTAGVTALPLPDLSAQGVVDHVGVFYGALPFAELLPDDLEATIAAQTPLRQTLGWLWDAVARPVLDHLDRHAPPHSRVWWVPTGLLAMLPLHAAEALERTDGSSVIDRLSSSYAPTVATLAAAKRRVHDAPPAGLRIVAAHDLAGMPALAGAAAEAALLLRRFPDAAGSLGAAATRAAALSAIEEGEWLHVAGHASSYRDDPTRSALHLHDGPLTVQEVMTSRSPGGRLAYLSACQTVFADPTSADEIIHLGSAFHLAGYRNVIGTMWRVPDGTAAATARLFYDAPRPPLDGAPAARALHRATRRLRAQYPLLPTRWAAYQHIGP